MYVLKRGDDFINQKTPKQKYNTKTGRETMLKTFAYFQNENTHENKKASRITWHMIFTIQDSFIPQDNQCWLLFQRAFKNFNDKLSRKLGYRPHYTRKYEASPEGRPHMHCCYYDIQDRDFKIYEKLWSLGHVQFTNDDGEMMKVENLEYMTNLAHYFYSDEKGQVPLDCKRQFAHSQGLKKLAA